MNNNKKLSRHYDEVLNNGVELIKFYHENPCIAAHDLLGVDFAPIQRVIFEDMWFRNFAIVVATRGFGKTFMLGTLATLSCLLKPGYRVGLIGRVFRQSLVVTNDNNYTFDTFWTSDGLQTSVENFYNNVLEGTTKTQSLYSQNTILSKWKNDDRACRSIKTTKGFELAGTVDHGIVVLNHDSLELEFKDLQDITENDYIAIKTDFNYFGNNNRLPNFAEFESNWRIKDCKIPKTLTSNLAYWMGLLVGDGCISSNKSKRGQCIDFVNEDQDLLDSFEKYLIEYFVDDVNNIDRRHRRNNTYEIRYYSKKLAQYLLKCGFTKTTALDKNIPAIIKKASMNTVVSFIQGIYDTDGCVYIQRHKQHGYTHCEVAFNTSSLQLAREVQSVLLNMGIVSSVGLSNKSQIKKLKCGNKPSVCSNSYKVRITGKVFLSKFYKTIGFRCERKQTLLKNYLNTHLKKEESLARSVGLPNSLVKQNNDVCKEFYKQGLYFVKMIANNYFFAPTVDVEVENESCYWANGFINHNSKMIFSEVEKLYLQSSILQEACAKTPTRGSDSCYLKFKSVGGMTPSYIEALPLGDDGSKIRGSRFYLILIDELAQIPDQILDMVVRPMAATSLAPMERVRRIEQKNKLIAKGLAIESDFEQETVNKMVMTSSGYYKFNHMWRRMNDYWRQIEIAKKTNSQAQFAVWQIPHWDLPDGFLDKNNIDEAKRVMSNAEFRMEYEAAMVSDSEGFFKASLLEACTLGNNFGLETSGDSNSQYVLGIDPNQGGKASCGLIVVKLGLANKIVVVSELKNQTTQQMTQAVQAVCESFNIVRVFMDRGGGGKAICDLLEDGYGNKPPLIDRTNEDHKHMEGRHILEMVNFNPGWIADANFTTKSMFEEKKLLFPELSLSSTQDYEVLNYENVNVLKSQLLNIIVTPTSTGLLHFDTPQKGQNKDLYSALILAAHGARIIAKEMEEAQDPVLFNSGGLVRMHKPGSSFDALYRVDVTQSNSLISAAVLKKKIK